MTIRFGFAGFRHNHIFSLYGRVQNHPQTAVAGAWEPLNSAREFAGTQGVEFTCCNLEQLLNDPSIDVIAVGSAYGERAEIVLQALRAGKHVISDKPFCTTPAELEQIEKLLQTSGKCLGCMFDLRTAPNFNRAKELLRTGAVGELCAIQFNGMHPLNYGTRPGWYFEKGMHGGTVNDIAIHLFDLLPYLTGKGVKKIIAAKGGNLHFPQVPHFSNTGVLMLELTNGAVISGDVSYFAPDFSTPCYWRFTVCGTEGVLEFNYNAPGVQLFTKEKHETLPPLPAEKDYFDAFLDELSGHPGTPCTAEILQTARWALTAQEKANLS